MDLLTPRWGTYISLFHLIVYLVRFNTNSKHFLIPNINTCVQCHNLHIFSRVLLLMGMQEWTVHDKFNLIQVRNYSRKYEHVCGATKKWQECSVKGHNYKFFPLDFPNLLNLINVHVVFRENKWFCFSKRDLRADTAHNKWLKEALKVIMY